MSDIPDDKFVYIRPIMGKGADAKKRYNHITEGGMNDVIKHWHEKQPEREFNSATPSRLTTCPRVVWLQAHNIPIINEQGWGQKQRMLLGRLFENQFATELEEEGILLHHWKDDSEGESVKFTMGKGLDLLAGTPDYLTKLALPTISDAKTSRGDSFGYVPIEQPEIWDDWGWYKYKVQLNAYYALCHANKEWFEKMKLPLPKQCHLFSYALDDGIVRREFIWTPTDEELEDVKRYTKRFNEALQATECPECTCQESTDEWEVRFCPYGVRGKDKYGKTSKVAASCCSDDLITEGTK